MGNVISTKDFIDFVLRLWLTDHYGNDNQYHYLDWINNLAALKGMDLCLYWKLKH